MKCLRIRGDQRGAVMVEFLIAFLPLFIFFECLVQVAGMYAAKLVTLHAATTGARAATVVLHDDPKDYEGVAVGQIEGRRKDQIEKAVAMPLRAVSSIVDVKITYPSSAGGSDNKTSYNRDELVRVKVEATYQCAVPFAKRLVCNAFSTRTKLIGEAALPNNGASYEYD